MVVGDGVLPESEPGGMEPVGLEGLVVGAVLPGEPGVACAVESGVAEEAAWVASVLLPPPQAVTKAMSEPAVIFRQKESAMYFAFTHAMTP